jgi:hypothetical protein
MHDVSRRTLGTGRTRIGRLELTSSVAGASLVEYIILVALVALGALGGAQVFGTTTRAKISSKATCVTTLDCAAGDDSEDGPITGQAAPDSDAPPPAATSGGISNAVSNVMNRAPDVLNAAMNVVNGIGNGFKNAFSVVPPNYTPNSTSEYIGAMIGSGGGMFVGGVGVAGGLTLGGGSTIVEVGSGGLATLVYVPAVIESGVLITTGGAIVMNGARNMMMMSMQKLGNTERPARERAQSERGFMHNTERPSAGGKPNEGGQRVNLDRALQRDPTLKNTPATAVVDELGELEETLTPSQIRDAAIRAGQKNQPPANRPK